MIKSTTFRRVLLDTGPLVAFLSQRDAYHELCREMFARIRPPLLTCWPVLTEVAWIIRQNEKGLQQFYQCVDKGLVEILPLAESELSQLGAHGAKYAKLRPQLADLALYHLAQRESLNVIFTLDRRDFSIFRGRKGERFQLLPEDL